MLRFSFLALMTVSLPVLALTNEEAENHRIEFFEKRIRPIFAGHCYQCHSADTKPSGGLRVDDRNGLLLGGEAGPAIVPGDPEGSLLLQRIQSKNPKRLMPKEGELLTPEQIADLTTWIQDGAAWPREKVPSWVGRAREDYEAIKASHWAWQPLREPAVPEVARPEWAWQEMDRFILAGLESKNLEPVAEADRLTLIRRVTFDLTGLPPTPDEITAFQNDLSPDAYARLVDRLLASPRFGERWGRHWLDVARYGESTGPSRNIPYPHAWRYRDYVIDATNRDVPFDRFIREQIAGDLLPATDANERDRLNTATGFLALGVKDVNQRFKVRFVMDNVDEQIDTVTRAILGLTVSCARCHDHKFDPIPVTDYYALAGIFTSTENCAGVRSKMGGSGLDYYNPSALLRLATEPPPPPREQVERLEAQVSEAKKAWDEIRDTPEGLAPGPNGRPKQRQFRAKFEKLKAELAALSDPGTRGFAIHGVRDGKTLSDTEVRIRGEAERLGPVVPRGFLTTFTVPEVSEVNAGQSGRLELAQWLTSTSNPLTARVAVNRVWKHLFGAGMVATVDNFGVKGDQPSHPELLDYLAAQFMREGWSLKKLVRSIVLSRAYGLGSDAPDLHREVDPANRLIWRHAPRRLEAEEIRDAMLAVSGLLDLNPPGASPVKDFKMVEMRDNGTEARAIHENADRSRVRSIYLPLLRGVIPKALEAFDPVTQSLVTGQREATTVPTQALYLLNATFVRQQALALAEKLVADPERFDAESIRQAYLLALGRPPAESEAQRVQSFLLEYASVARTETSAKASLSLHTGPEEPNDEANAATELAVPANPDDIERTDEHVREATVEPKTAKAAAWMALVQSLYASAEFRFIR